MSVLSESNVREKASKKSSPRPVTSTNGAGIRTTFRSLDNVQDLVEEEDEVDDEEDMEEDAADFDDVDDDDTFEADNNRGNDCERSSSGV